MVGPGPNPVLISRSEVDALYILFEAVTTALAELNINYIVTGGTLLGCVRQHSILFCDDDIDIAIVCNDDDNIAITLETLRDRLPDLLGKDFIYKVRPCEFCDRVRWKKSTGVFLDIFSLRRYNTRKELFSVLGTKKNGQPQSISYIEEIYDIIKASCTFQGERGSLYPLWHFADRKAIELWPKEAYRERKGKL